jgi:hypothetical protein
MDEIDFLARTARWLAALPGEVGTALLSLVGMLIGLATLLRASRRVPLNSAFARRPPGAESADASAPPGPHAI